MKEWRYTFSLAEVERGYNLYFSGYVTQLKIEKDSVKAKVGNEYVNILFNQDIIVSMQCSCKEQHCQHIAASLIAYEYKNHPYINHSLTTDEIINQLSLKQKDDLLRKILNEDDTLRWYANKLLGVKADHFPQEEFTLHQLLYQYNLDGKIYNLQLFIHQFIERNKKEEDQFIYIQLLNRLKVFENEKTIQLILYQVLDSLSIFLKEFPFLQKEIFDLLMKDTDNEIFLDYLYDHFRIQPYLQIKLDLINHHLNRILALNAWAKPYFIERYIVKKLQVLYDLDDIEEMNRILEEYYAYPKVREFFIAEALQKEDYKQAIRIIKDSKKLDENNQFLLIQYQNYLIDIYEKLDSKKYFEALYYQLFKLDIGDFDTYLRFKKVCPSKLWFSYFYELIDLPMKDSRLYDILLEEQEYTLLFKHILQTQNLYYLERKRSILLSKCPNEYKRVYELIKKALE